MAKKVTKIITKIKKFTEKADPLGAGLLNPIVDPMADQWLGTDMTGAKAEAKAAAEKAAAEQAAMMQSLVDQSKRANDANVDLSLDNVPIVETGGTASGLAAGSTVRKRKSGQSLSASLGINA
jgi:hypothetical protein